MSRVALVVPRPPNQRVDRIPRLNRVLHVPRQRDRDPPEPRGERDVTSTASRSRTSHPATAAQPDRPPRRPCTSSPPPRRRRHPPSATHRLRPSRANRHRFQLASAITKAEPRLDERRGRRPDHARLSRERSSPRVKRPCAGERRHADPVARVPARPRSSGAKAPCTASQTRNPSSTSISTLYGWYDSQPRRLDARALFEEFRPGRVVGARPPTRSART